MPDTGRDEQPETNTVLLRAIKTSRRSIVDTKRSTVGAETEKKHGGWPSGEDLNAIDERALAPTPKSEPAVAEFSISTSGMMIAWSRCRFGGNRARSLVFHSVTAST